MGIWEMGNGNGKGKREMGNGKWEMGDGLKQIIV